MVVKVFFVINAKPERLDMIHTALKKNNEVAFLCKVESGPYDIVSLIEVDSYDDYRLLVERIATLPHIDDFTSFFIVDS